MAALFLAMTAIFLALAAHPFTTYPASLWLLRRLRPARFATFDNQGSSKQSFAICVCAYNEAQVIRRKIENLLELRQRTRQLQILVYVDGSTDGTDGIVREHAMNGSIDAVISNERRGKTYGMNRLVRHAKSSVVAFTDANVELQPDALLRLEKYFTDPDIGCVCGHLTYVNPDETATAATGSLYWRLEEGMKQLESDTGSVMGADGSLFAIRRQLHQPVPVDMIDDMYLSFSLLCEGYRIVRAPDALAFEKSVPDPDEEYRRKIRIACQAFNVHRALWLQIRGLGGLDLYKYVSHKLLRWMTILLLALAALSTFAALAAAAGLAVASGVAAALVGITIGGIHLRLRPFILGADILRSFLGAGIGVLKSLQGERFQTWAPAGSIRHAAGQK